MAELLELGDFDEHNLKACCCFHEEKTPSLIYNKKNYTFHCFGCGKTVDIIDCYMLNGSTYIDALKKLFEEADIKYAFGEHKVKTRSSYRYPKEVVCKDKSAVYRYAKLRKISEQTIDLLDIRQDDKQNVVFNYYDTNDVLTMVKYRPSGKIRKGENKPKCWCQKDADTTHLLFNINRVNVDEPLLITEGEFDTLAAVESGFSNAVSVPFGAGNFQWIEENWDFLEQFKSIIICSDNDSSGIKMQKEAVYRLGSWRTKVVDIPQVIKDSEGDEHQIKDLNEVLFYGGKEKVLSLILNAKDCPVESVIDYSDIKEVNLSDIDGIYTGFRDLDAEIMRLFYGTFNVLTGINGSGKSSFLAQLICQSLEQNKDVWLYSKELPNYMTKNWINYILSGRRHLEKYETNRGSIYYKVDDHTKRLIDDYYRGRVYVYKDGWANTIEDIKISLEDSARKFGSKLFIIDNLTAVDLKCSEENKWEKQAEFVRYLIDFAQRFHVVVVLVIHPHKVDCMRRLSKMDIQGSGSMVDLAHRVFSLYRVSEQDRKGIPSKRGDGWYKEPIKHDVILDVLKDRMRGKEGLAMGLYYDVPSRRFFTNEEEFGYQYAWDTNTYTDTIPYPIADVDDELFGRVDNAG